MKEKTYKETLIEEYKSDIMLYKINLEVEEVKVRDLRKKLKDRKKLLDELLDE